MLRTQNHLEASQVHCTGNLRDGITMIHWQRLKPRAQNDVRERMTRRKGGGDSYGPKRPRARLGMVTGGHYGHIEMHTSNAYVSDFARDPQGQILSNKVRSFM